MNHSPVGLFVFSLFLFLHVRQQHDTAFAVLDRSFLFSRADQCVLQYLSKTRKTGSRLLKIFPYLVDRCAVSQYFKLEHYGAIFNSFPVFKSNLEQCSTFLFIGSTSEEIHAELEIFNSTEFQLIGCNYLVIDDRPNIFGLKNYKHVPQLSSIYLVETLEKFRMSENLIIEHLFISQKMRDFHNFYEDVLKIRDKFRVIPCQITIRFPASYTTKQLLKFSNNILKTDPYTLMSIRKNNSLGFIEFYLFASAEYHCMMRYF